MQVNKKIINLLTPKEAANILRLNVRTFYKMVHTEKIHHFRVGRKMLFKNIDIENFLNQKSSNSHPNEK